MHGTPRKSEFRFTGVHMLICVLVFFGVIIAVNLTMATLASRSWTGLVVKNSYVASQEFNSKLAQARAQKLRGWSSEVKYQQGSLSFSLKDKDGRTIKAGPVLVKIGRPAFEQEDQVYTLSRSGDGVFSKDLALNSGPWALEIEAEANGVPFRRNLRFLVDEKQNGEIQ